jgi:hypothetical protein
VFFPHVELFIDASKTGLGAYWGNSVYQLSLGLRRQENIAVLEAINIVVALRVWASEFKNEVVRVWCDNAVAVTVLNLGRGCDPIMQSIARNVWMLTSVFDIKHDFQHVLRVVSQSQLGAAFSR